MFLCLNFEVGLMWFLLGSSRMRGGGLLPTPSQLGFLPPHYPIPGIPWFLLAPMASLVHHPRVSPRPYKLSPGLSSECEEQD